MALPIKPSPLPKGATATRYYTTAAEAQHALAQPTDIVGQGVRFQTGKGYYLGVAPKAAAPAATASPTGAMTPAQLLAAATSSVNKTVNPQITALNSQAQQQAAGDQNLINGYTNNAVGQVKAIDFGAPYKAAAQDQNAVNTALLASLTGQGQSLQNQLAGELGGSVDPGMVQGVSGIVGHNVVGAGNANLARGDATLSQLLSQGAAAKTYGNSLPGLELLAGQQDTAKTQGAINQNLSTAVTNLRSQIPGLVQSAQSNLVTQQQRATQLQQQQASADANLQVKKLALLQNQILADNAQGLKKQAEADTTAYRKAQVQLGEDRITAGENEAQARIAAQQQAAQTRAAATVAAAQARAAAAGNKMPSAQQINKLVDGWKNGTTKNVTTTVREPKPDANGNPVYRQTTKPQTTGQLPYIQAYKKLISMHVPDAQARQYLDSAYKRGEQGRAWLTNGEQTTLRANKTVTPSAHVYNGNVAYLDRAQAALLQKAGQLPPGHWIQGSTKTKDLGPIYLIAQGFD